MAATAKHLDKPRALPVDLPAGQICGAFPMLSKSISNIEARVEEIRIEIARHPLSLELAILEEALGKLRGIMTAPPVEATPRPELSAPEPAQPGRITLLEAAERTIEEAPYPVPT